MSPKRRVATRSAHQHFCEIEGWEARKTAKGKSGTHHINYELSLPEGRILWTRVSHPPDSTDYGQELWSHILRDQLQVSSDEFWACVENGELPDRGVPEAPPSDAIPLQIIHTLIRQARIPEEEVRAMSKEEAIARLMEFYSQGS